MSPSNAWLKLIVPSPVLAGGEIAVTVDALNAAATIVLLEVPDTIVVEQPHSRSLGKGTFTEILRWRVLHAQEGKHLVDVIASAGKLLQRALCHVQG